MKNQNFEVTITYKAVITVSVKAKNEQDAKAKALEIFTKSERNNWYNKKDIQLQDDCFKATGVLNMDESWNMIND